MKKKVLTLKIVQKLGLDKVEHITADMLEGYTNIGDYAFYNCIGLKSVIIPNSVTSIGRKTFFYCAGLKSVIIPNSVTSIGDDAFYGCSGLTAVTIPNSVTTIGSYAFFGCSGLTSVEIPNSVISIGNYAFDCCTDLTSMTIGDIEYKKQEVIDGKCKAYKAFNGDMTCREFQYEEGKAYKIDCEIELCKRGFHACLNLSDVFNYYYGKLGKAIHIHEVELEGILEGILEKRYDDSKVVAKKITISKRII